MPTIYAMAFLPLTHSVIYVLVDPIDGLVRYVGTSKNPNTRLKEHLRELDGDHELKVWIKGLVENKKSPLMVILDTCPSIDAALCEMKWIHHFDRFGYLFNNRKK